MAETALKIILGILLLLCGVQDFIKRKIGIPIVIFGVLLTIICIPFCRTVSLLERFCGLGIGILVLVISKITEGKIGLGDGLLLCITGMGMGFWSNLELFGMALFFAALTSILLLVSRRADRKKSIPFVPFLLIAYLILTAIQGRAS